MDVFALRERLVKDYESYVGSFIKIKDARIEGEVMRSLDEGLLWPDPLIQLNPSFEAGESIDELVDEGVLHEECSRIFRTGKDREDPGKDLWLHRHQSEAIRIARAGHNYVLTTGTGSGKSLAYIVPIVDHVLRRGPGKGIQAIVVYPMNALAVHRALMVYGFRYRPRYEQEMHTEVVPTTCNDLLEPLRNVGNDVLSVEQLLLPAKLEAVRDYFRKGTVVYTHYVDGIVAPIRRYLEDMGFTVGLYTGGDKSGLGPFLKGEADTLIGTRPVGTGLDGLQSVCDRLIMISLPWTGAEYEQIVGRVRRQGSAFGQVEIIVPQVMLDHEGDIWSWDKGRMACIQYKRTLSDCAVDGHIPETVRINPEELRKQSREALERWIERIGEEGLLAIERERLTVPLPPDLR